MRTTPISYGPVGNSNGDNGATIRAVIEDLLYVTRIIGEHRVETVDCN